MFRYSFPEVLPESSAEVDEDNGVDSTVLYRIQYSTISPEVPGKKPIFIENAILCEYKEAPCEVNRPKIAVGKI